jgi:hypothetical protein
MHALSLIGGRFVTMDDHDASCHVVYALHDMPLLSATSLARSHPQTTDRDVATNDSKEKEGSEEGAGLT